MIRLNENIKWLRKRQHLTQEEIAKKIGVAKTTYASWEQGARSPKFKDALKIADYFGVDIDELLTGNVMLPDDKIELNETETELIRTFRKLDDNQQNAVIVMMKAMAK